jgi:hypothetical protein
MINQKSYQHQAQMEADTSFNNNYQQVDEWIPKNQNHLEMKLKELGEKTYCTNIKTSYDRNNHK